MDGDKWLAWLLEVNLEGVIRRLARGTAADGVALTVSMSGASGCLLQLGHASDTCRSSVVLDLSDAPDVLKQKLHDLVSTYNRQSHR